MPENPLVITGIVSAIVALIVGISKYRRDGQQIVSTKEVEKAKLEAQREIEKAKNETERAKADTAAHAQTVTGLTALCNAQHEQIELLQQLHKERLVDLELNQTSLREDLRAIQAREAECREKLALVMNRLGLEP